VQGDDHRCQEKVLDMIRGRESSQREEGLRVAGMGTAWMQWCFSSIFFKVSVQEMMQGGYRSTHEQGSSGFWSWTRG
jgi:hypothetical protein